LGSGTITDFSGGTYTDTADPSDEYDVTTGQLKLSFPYAKKGANLMSYWRLENNATDETGNNDGNVSGATYTPSGRFDGAFDFDGIDDIIDMGDITSMDGKTAATWVFWIKPDTFTADAAILRKLKSSSWAFSIGLVDTSVGSPFTGMKLMVYDGTNFARWDSGNGELSTSMQMVAVVWSGGSSASLYVNGVSKTFTHGTVTGDGSPTSIANVTEHCSMGARYNAGSEDLFFDGIIDEMKMYDTALSPAEITALYNSNKQHTSTGLWKSLEQTITASSKLLNSIITHSGLSATYYIDKIEWLVSDVVKATYDTNIITGASTTITTPTSGSFDDVNANFTIKVYMVGDGDNTPTVTEIEWNDTPTGAGWTGKVNGVTNPSSVNSILSGNISKINGVS